MGTEALSKVARRDIRRAFAPEASEEILKFIDGVKADLDKRLLDSGAAFAAEHKRSADMVHGFNARLARFEVNTMWQRLRWLWSGTWV